MASFVQCSNCGITMRTVNNGQEELMLSFGDWGKLGDACYCKRCLMTWKERNSKCFEECGGKFYGKKVKGDKDAESNSSYGKTK